MACVWPLGVCGYSFGVVGMTAHLYPDRAPGSTDDYRDLGIDASYQFLGNRSNIFTANAAYIHEHQDLTASWLAGNAARTRLMAQLSAHCKAAT